MANGLANLFNFSSNEEALREGARQRLELQSRAAGRNVASVSAQSATNPAAIARNVNEAQSVERSRVGAEYQSALMQAQQADQARAGQFVGSLLGTAGSLLGTVIPGADVAGKAAQGIANGVTQAATQSNAAPAPVSVARPIMPNPSSYVQAPQNAPLDYRAPIAPPEQTPGTALGNPSASLPPGTAASPSQLSGPVEFNNAQTFLNAGTAPNGTTTPPRQQGPSPTPTLPAPAAMAGVAPPIQGTTPPPPVVGPTATPGTIEERPRQQADTDFLQRLFSLQRR